MIKFLYTLCDSLIKFNRIHLNKDLSEYDGIVYTTKS